MSAARKTGSINTHVVDILGNVKGRDQPIMLMDKALQLVDTLPDELFLSEDVVFFDPFCKAGEILLSCAFNSCIHKSKKHKKFSMFWIFKGSFMSQRDIMHWLQMRDTID